jgi:hypothetical protein
MARFDASVPDYCQGFSYASTSEWVYGYIDTHKPDWYNAYKGHS